MVQLGLGGWRGRRHEAVYQKELQVTGQYRGRPKLYTYQKAISNLADKRRHIFLATTDTCGGNLIDDYTRLLRFVARIQYPGAGVEGSYDVDGLRSQAVAFARRTVVGAGVWRANFKTITAWAHRTRVAADQG